MPRRHTSPIYYPSTFAGILRELQAQWEWAHPRHQPVRPVPTEHRVTADEARAKLADYLR